jgi:hypothetical protein
MIDDADLKRLKPYVLGWIAGSRAGQLAGGGAPDDAMYLTLAGSALLSQERVFTPGNGLTASDGGAGGAYGLTVNLGSGLTFSAGAVVLQYSGSPVTIVPDAVTAAGSSAYAAHTDHTHAIACAAAASLSVSTTNTEGASTSFARADHTHAITSSANPGAAAAILASNASGYLQLVRLGLGVAPSYPLHVLGTSEQARIAYDANNYASLSVASNGALTIDTTTSGTGGNLILTPAGNLITDPDGLSILPAAGYEINIGAINNKYLTLHAAELWVETLVAQNTIATIGGRILVGPTTTLTRDLAAAGTQIYVKHNQAAAGETVYLEANGQVEFLYITGGPVLQAEGDYRYNVTRNRDGSGANDWYAGDAVFNTGGSGDGWIDLYSLRGAGGMRLDYIYNFNSSGIGSGYSGNYADDTTWQMFGDGANTETNDCVYFGRVDSVFSQLTHNISVAAVYTATLAWEYWNGSAWTSFVPATDSDLKSTGGQSITWGDLAGWATTNINGTTAYWIRRRITAFTSWTTLPTVNLVRTDISTNWGPTIVGNVRNSNVFNNWSEHWAVGNLNGLYDYGSDVYGFAAGKYSAATTWLSADATNGIRMMRGDTCLGQWAINGVITLGDAGGGEYLTLSSSGLEIFSNAVKVVDIDNNGDFVFGQVATGKSNLFWDQSAGRLNFRGSTNGTVVQAYVDTDGSITAGGGVVLMNSAGLSFVVPSILDDAAAVKFTQGGTPYGLLSSYRGAGPGYGVHTILKSVATGNEFVETVIQSINPAGQAGYINLEVYDASSLIGLTRLTKRTSSSAYLGSTVSVYIEGTLAGANAKSTLGLTINQGGADDEIVSLKSSDVAHGVTVVTETDTYGVLSKYNSANGGLEIDGLCDTGTVGLALTGLEVSDNTTKGTSGLGAITLVARKKNSTNVANVGTNGNLVVIRNNATTQFIFDAEGDSHENGTGWTAYDDYDDLALLNALDHTLDPVRMAAGKWLRENREALQSARIVNFGEDGVPFVNKSRLSMLLVGAVRQMGERIHRLESALTDAGINPNLLQ